MDVNQAIMRKLRQAEHERDTRDPDRHPRVYAYYDGMATGLKDLIQELADGR